MKNTFILFAFLILTAIGCKKPQGFEYRSIKNIHVDKLGLQKSRLNMDLVYYNPNHFGVTLKKVNCDVFINNIFIGKYALDTTLHIARESEFVLPSRMEVNMISLYKDLIDVIISKEVTLTAKGTTRVGKSGIYVSIPIHYEGKQKLSLF